MIPLGVAIPGGILFSREAGLASGVRRELLSVDENLPANRIVTMDRILTDSIATRRFVLFLLGREQFPTDAGR